MTSRTSLVERLLEAGAGVGAVLGIETGARSASLGVVGGGRVLASLDRVLLSHCAGLPDAIDEILAKAALRISDLSGIAVGLGPGSFTGLRVGLSYAKGIVAVTGSVLVGVSSLEAMALQAFAETDTDWTICPVLDGHRGAVYAALYRIVEDALEKRGDDFALPTEGLSALASDQVVFIGEAGALAAHRLVIDAGGQSKLVNGMELRGAMVAVLGAAGIARNERGDPAALEPRYVGSRRY
jgi:tRNA threonylcarbamoyladenosine biosynthesis protein TsaB